MGSFGVNRKGIVAVFDFDRTLIGCDSDDWVVEGLGLREIFEQLRPTMGWNALMNRMMVEHHSRGKSFLDIADCLKKVPLDPHLISAIKSAHALGCDLRIVSDANMFFIETILEHHGLANYFAEIYTNPGTIDEEGRLKITPYLDFDKSPHGCPLCPANMCKGMIIERIRAEASEKGESYFIYLGDGRNDFCPSLKLTKMDYLMPRKNYPVWELIRSNAHLIKAEVHEWCNGVEQAEILLQLIDKIFHADDNAAEPLVADFEQPTVPLPPSSLDGFPKILQVPV